VAALIKTEKATSLSSGRSINIDHQLTNKWQVPSTKRTLQCKLKSDFYSQKSLSTACMCIVCTFINLLNSKNTANS